MSDDVIVSCKLLHGLYIEVNKKRILLKGIQQSGRSVAPFFMPPSHIVGLTKVPREFWEAWIKDHREFAPVKKGLIFASEKKQDAVDEAKEKAGVKHGLERIDPDKLPKEVKAVKAGEA